MALLNYFSDAYMSVYLASIPALVIISDKLGVPSAVILFLGISLASLLWWWLKESGYLLTVAAGVLIFLIIVQLLGPKDISNFVFLGILLAWVMWKIDANKNKD